MTHQVMAFLGRVRQEHCPQPTTVLEVGSRNVNGMARTAFPDALSYTGVDIEAGEGVDRVIDGERLTDHFPLNRFDVVMCFPAGTVISGSGTTIEKLKVGDAVRGAKGQIQKVTQTFSRTHSGEIIRLRCGNLPDIRMTPEHPVLVTKVRRIHQCNTKDEQKAVYEHVAAEPVWKKASEVSVNDWLVVPKQTEEKQHSITFPVGRGRKLVTYPVDEGLAWLLGMYVAEGFTHFPTKAGGRTTFALHAKETYYADRLIEELYRLGLHGAAYQTPALKKNNGRIVVCDCKGFAQLLVQLCGKGAVNKRVPECILASSSSVARAFISGVTDGDGCLRRGKTSDYYTISTVSPVLAHGLLEALYKIGIQAGMSNPAKGTATIQGRAVNTKDFQNVYWSKRAWDGTLDKAGRVPYGLCRFIGDVSYVRVRETATETVSDLPVYNIETEDHTYGVPFTVHNCTEVLEHCVRPWMIVDQMKAVLKPSGLLIVSTPTYGFPLHRHPIDCYRFGEDAYRLWLFGDMQLLTLDRLVDDLGQPGLAGVGRKK